MSYERMSSNTRFKSSYLRPTAASFRLDLMIKKMVTRIAMNAMRIEPRSMSLCCKTSSVGYTEISQMPASTQTYASQLAAVVSLQFPKHCCLSFSPWIEKLMNLLVSSFRTSASFSCDLRVERRTLQTGSVESRQKFCRVSASLVKCFLRMPRSYLKIAKLSRTHRD